MNSQNWIGGEWGTPNGGSHPVYNPSQMTEVVGTVFHSSTSDVRQVDQAARTALKAWTATSLPVRGEYLYTMARVLEEHATEVATLSSREMGKPISEMAGEVIRGVKLLRYYAGEGVRTNGSVIPHSQDHVLQYSTRIPLGVVAVITPWNFPVAIPVWKIAPALICGNTVIWKPSEMAALTATLLTSLFAQAGLPAGVLNLLVGEGANVGKLLVSTAAVDGISFTGSTKTGMAIAAVAAERNVKYQVEMGGKNAAVVLDDADLSLSVPAILSGAFRSAGQKCTATSRLIVQADILDPFIAALREGMQEISMGDARDSATYLGPVASAAQYAKVQRYAEMAQTEEMVSQDINVTVDPAQGYFVAPHVIMGVDVESPLVQEEIFGPIATILPAADLDDAIALCNQTVYGLSASVFTRDISRGFRFLEEADAGMVRINQETAGVEYQAPFGGMKHSSSHSREQGTSALEFYSQTKTCAVYFGS